MHPPYYKCIDNFFSKKYKRMDNFEYLSTVKRIILKRTNRTGFIFDENSEV